MTNKQEIIIFIESSRQGEYFTVPFTVPDDVESLTLCYQYPRKDGTISSISHGDFTSHKSINIVDLGLIAPDSTQVGASGSDKFEITVSEHFATPGYTPRPIVAGKWSILVGAYKIAQPGVEVIYTISYKHKSTQLLFGDLHTHTFASDGVHSAEELCIKAMRNGLDYLAITDHNQMVSADALPKSEAVTLIPGVEWTHYLGHANFLGVDQPYDGSFAVNTPGEMQKIFQTAHQRGSLIVVNHPFETGCEFKFDLKTFHFDCLEIWNGPMRESNLRAVGLWQQMLVQGLKVPMVSGSDYHRDTPFIFLGGPTLGVYAQSAGVSDILNAIRAGHSFATFAPNGPTIDMHSGNAGIGNSTPWEETSSIYIEAQGLLKGDVLRLITAEKTTNLLKSPEDGQFCITLPVAKPGFIRVEILRAFLPGIPPLPALISNPIWFDEG